MIKHTAKFLIAVAAIAIVIITLGLLLSQSRRPFNRPGAILFQAFDAVTWPRRHASLTCRLTESASGGGIAQEPVAFYLPNGKVVLTTTNSRGTAVYWLRFEAVGDHRVRSAVTQDSEYIGADDEFLLRIRRRDFHVVWVDVKALVPDASKGPWYGPHDTPVAVTQDARSALKQLGEKFGIVYLMHGPQEAYRETRLWLRRQDVPLGPLLYVEEGDRPAALARLQSCWPKVRASIGSDSKIATLYNRFVKNTHCLRRADEELDKTIPLTQWTEFVNLAVGNKQQ